MTAESGRPSDWRIVSGRGHLWRWDPGAAGGPRHLPAFLPCRVGTDRSPVCVHFLVVLSCAALRPFWNEEQLLECVALAADTAPGQSSAFPGAEVGCRETAEGGAVWGISFSGLASRDLWMGSRLKLQTQSLGHERRCHQLRGVVSSRISRFRGLSGEPRMAPPSL